MKWWSSNQWVGWHYGTMVGAFVLATQFTTPPFAWPIVFYDVVRDSFFLALALACFIVSMAGIYRHDRKVQAMVQKVERSRHNTHKTVV